MPLEVVHRRTWGALDIDKYLPRLAYPVTRVWYCFCTAFYKHGPRVGATEIQCVEYMQQLQKWDMRRKRDIRFNFVICPDLNIYRGRGWNNAAFLPHKYKQWNDKSIYIAYLGDFRKEAPTVEMLQKRTEITRYGVENNYIREKFHEINLKHELIPLLFEELLHIN